MLDGLPAVQPDPAVPRPAFPPQRAPAPAARTGSQGTAGGGAAGGDTTNQDTANQALGAPAPQQPGSPADGPPPAGVPLTRQPGATPAVRRVAADRLFDPGTPVTSQTVATLVDNARAQQANPQFDGTAGRRPVGPGLWLAWDDAGDRPVIAPSGGVLVIAAGDGNDRIGVARDSVSGAVYAWDMDQGTPWVDSEGAPARLDAETLRAHAGTGDGFSALDLAHIAAFETEVRALAEADEASLPGVVANLNALLTEMSESDHPLFDMADPYIRAVEQAIPLIAGAARWGRRTERGAARQILDQFLTLLHTGLDNPARLPEIKDPARETRATDPTRVAAHSHYPDELAQMRESGDLVQYAENPDVGTDANTSGPPVLQWENPDASTLTGEAGQAAPVQSELADGLASGAYGAFGDGYTENPIFPIPSNHSVEGTPGWDTWAGSVSGLPGVSNGEVRAYMDVFAMEGGDQEQQDRSSNFAGLERRTVNGLIEERFVDLPPLGPNENAGVYTSEQRAMLYRAVLDQSLQLTVSWDGLEARYGANADTVRDLLTQFGEVGTTTILKRAINRMAGEAVIDEDGKARPDFFQQLRQVIADPSFADLAGEEAERLAVENTVAGLQWLCSKPEQDCYDAFSRDGVTDAERYAVVTTELGNRVDAPIAQAIIAIISRYPTTEQNGNGGAREIQERVDAGRDGKLGSGTLSILSSLGSSPQGMADLIETLTEVEGPRPEHDAYFGLPIDYSSAEARATQFLHRAVESGFALGQITDPQTAAVLADTLFHDGPAGGPKHIRDALPTESGLQSGGGRLSREELDEFLRLMANLETRCPLLNNLYDQRVADADPEILGGLEPRFAHYLFDCG